MATATTPKKKAPAKTTKAKATPKKSAAKKAAPKKEAPKVSKREQAAKEKAEKLEQVRKAKIAAGDLIVTKTHEYEKAPGQTKSLERAQAIMATLKKAKEPVTVKQLADDLGAYYEEVLPALTMLEATGVAERYEALAGGRGRRQVAYMLTA